MELAESRHLRVMLIGAMAGRAHLVDPWRRSTNEARELRRRAATADVEIPVQRGVIELKASAELGLLAAL